jgi:sodium transport system permease protein
MNLRQVKLVYFKEMKDILRDKRTIRLMILVPVIFYPLMSFGISGLAMKAAESEIAKAAPVLLVGEAPELQAALAAESDQVALVTSADFADRMAALNAAEYPAAHYLDAWRADPYDGLDDSSLASFYYAALKGRVINCVVEVPRGFDPYTSSSDTVHIPMYYDEQEFRSDEAERKVRRILHRWRDTLTVALLEQAGMTESDARYAIKPFWTISNNVAPAEKQTGFLLAMMLPYMIVLTVMLGAMYPAIDLTAGEKERGTLETILASPAGRNEVTLGKFLCVFTAAMVTVLLGATSMIVTSGFGFAQFANQEAESAAFVLSVNPASFIVVVILMIPTAVLLSAVLLAIAVMARSFKEAQGYVTPLMFAVIVPSMVAFMPGMELNAALAWVPVSNIALGVKAALLTAKGEGFPWPLFGIVFLSTAVYASFALFMVRQMFNKESVLFRT